jgi:hypothetical protein
VLDYLRTFTPEEEKISWTDWHEEEVNALMAQQEERVRVAKEEGQQLMPAIFWIIDDLADRGDLLKNPRNPLNKLFFSGRHSFQNCVCSVQRVRALSLPIRLNATLIAIFKVRNQKEYIVFEEEMSAVVDKKTFRKLYEAATEEAHSFLLVLPNRPLDRTFYIRFEHGVSFSPPGL